MPSETLKAFQVKLSVLQAALPAEEMGKTAGRKVIDAGALPLVNISDCNPPKVSSSIYGVTAAATFNMFNTITTISRSKRLRDLYYCCFRIYPLWTLSGSVSTDFGQELSDLTSTGRILVVA